MVEPVFKFIDAFLKAAKRERALEFLADEDERHGAEQFVFWVDWREADKDIVQACEDVIKTGKLSAAEVNDGEDYKLFVVYGNSRHEVPLTDSPSDRHITLCSLNDVLVPDYEIRFCRASDGSDTLAFIVLPMATFSDLETKYGDPLTEQFQRLSKDNNLFSGSEDSDTAVESPDDRIRLLMGQGTVSSAACNWRGGVQCFEEAWNLLPEPKLEDPRANQITRELAHGHFELRNFQTALEFFLLLAKCAPMEATIPRVAFRLGVCYYETEDFDKAYKYLHDCFQNGNKALFDRQDPKYLELAELTLD